ncbi:MAG: hypothetical protein A3C84_04245 [Candidatus Ryanbacteria bacterium RIFCSPHIGHO2_02_FULL_48_12]|uniref:DUF2946 domain-containing protein n=1 Tax=Candidatus Ryanbacteria bacterium RIFCSPHIGHO2_01_FULL_48_27 TaxID=1802115 RepID=A0A1G2G5I3_9BACT|nr:MAG: hypothetical protein A2756_00710 [Candidatus Ryanbacteria bacterium RIFCSPHIGHO2_01_FULL_48_27]OGZ48574.1 MAG: hypothetical protein A3C84_04245 [Candidatus Ryanbacteria bacterium RIFCSPHIGHO2_02_FULL_48_12]
MSISQSTLAKTLFSFGAVVFILMGTLGLSHFGMNMKMDMDGNMDMSDCFMPGMAAICNMSLLEHITTWQHAFLAPPQQYGILSLLLLFVFVLGAGHVRWQYPLPKNILQALRSRVAQSYSLPATPLQELFSDGILNPKLF